MSARFLPIPGTADASGSLDRDLDRHNNEAAVRNKSGEGAKNHGRDHHRCLRSAQMRGRGTEHDHDEPYCSERCQNRGDTG